MGARVAYAPRWWLSADEFKRAYETSRRWDQETKEADMRVLNSDPMPISLTCPAFSGRVRLSDQEGA